MRIKASEDMSDDEYRQLEIDIKTTNPHRRCICFNQNNYEGTCNYCEWEEENSQEKGE